MDKRIPMRTCIGCREVKPKGELLRIVRQPGEAPGTYSLLPDAAGTMSGRGAYMCRSLKCLETAVRRRGFERAFRMSVPQEGLDSLKAAVEELIEA